jgi:septum formation protein
VIGADTFVTVDGKLLGKPKSKQDAIRMLKAQSGKTQKVYSGVAIIDAKTKRELMGYELTKIKVRKLSHEEIVRYVNAEKPMDKAGAMSIQGLGAIFIEKIDGCYYNVIGLPLHKIVQLLKKFNVSIFAYERWKNIE